MKRMALLSMLMMMMAPAALASAATVDVRVEGATQTLFEGPVRSSGNLVRVASDNRQRHCDGTNNSQHPTPGASATGAAVEALRTAGMDFDAKWFPGFDDYYINRFGPDGENADTYTFWGILVDDVFTDVGGCQAQVVDGDRVLWAYDAFHSHGFLKLAVAGDTAATPTPTATILAGQPLTVSVTRAYGEKSPAFAGVGGVTVAPVTTAANGVQSVQPTAPGAATTAVDGTANVIFGTPGWHRIKADAGAGGAIRSNRIDVCVVSAPSGTCGAAPADTAVREAVPLPPDPVDPGAGGSGATPSKPGGGKAPAQLVGAPIIELPRFTTAGQKAGRVGVRWRVLQPGVGVRRWRFTARPASKRSGTFTALATGTKGSSAQLELGAGQTWTVQVTFTDNLGRDVSQTVGDVLVPVDAGARAVRRNGSWSRVRDSRAWLGAVHRGRPGATLTARLAAGRPTILVRGVRSTADVEVRVGSKRAVYRISGSATGATREIVAARRPHARTVRVRIVTGTAGVDGLGVRP